MFRNRFGLCATFAVLLTLSARMSHAAYTPPVADPGFAYVDVNNDGKYSASSGDIGLNSKPSVDINALILSDGIFNTQVSKGAYHASCGAVSLVIPASQTLSLSVPLKLTAGKHIIVHGVLDAPYISLQACANLDLTKSTLNFDTTLNAHANCSATLDGMTALGDAVVGQINIVAGQSVSAGVAGDGTPMFAFAGTDLDITGGCSLSMDSAYLLAAGQDADVSLKSSGSASITSSSIVAYDGTIEASSDCSTASLLTNDIQGNAMIFSARGDLSITGSSIQSNDAVTLTSSGKVFGSTGTSLSANSLTVSGTGGVDMRSSSLAILPGAVSMTSSTGTIRVDSAGIVGLAGISLHAAKDLSLTGASLAANHYYSLVAGNSTGSGGCGNNNGCDGYGGNNGCGGYGGNNGCGGSGGSLGSIYAANSYIAGNISVTTSDTSITAQASGSVDVTGGNWTTPASISITSTSSVVTLPGASMNVLVPGSQIAITAHTGPIDATGAVFNVLPVFGPNGIRVLR